MTSCPHAPYADGPPGFAIGLRPIDEPAWFEGGEEPGTARARKQALLERAPDAVWAESPGSRPAQAEAADLVSRATGRVPTPGVPPLLAAALNVSDDLCLMERRGGEWTLTALSLSAGTFFTAGEVVGRSLRQLHEPVPAFSERLLARVTRIFDALQPELILERRNWTVINSAEPHLPDPEPVRAALAALGPDRAGSGLFIRVERQTLRRLPGTGGLLFTIRVWTQALAEAAESPERFGAFARAWREAPPEFRAYKRLELYDPLVESFLSGVIPGLHPTGE